MVSVKEIPLIESKQLESYYMNNDIEALLLGTQKNDFLKNIKAFTY